jgi:hypothetical protein
LRDPKDQYPDLRIPKDPGTDLQIPPGRFRIQDPGIDPKDPGTDLEIRVLILRSGYIMMTEEMIIVPEVGSGYIK